MAWLRLHDEVVDDPKVQRLPDAMFKAWINMLCLAKRYDGVVPKNDIAFALRISEKGATAIVNDLVERNLFEDHGDVVTPHNWDGRQYKSDSSTERVKRFRKHKRNVSGNVSSEGTKRDETVSGNAPETETEQISVSKETGAIAPPDPKAEYFHRGRQILGRTAGGMLAKLLKSYGDEDDPIAIAKARARIEDASTKANPAEWIGRVMAKPNGEARVII